MTSSSDIDSHPLPKNGLLDDEFDQQTGVLTTPMQDALTEIDNSKGEIDFMMTAPLPDINMLQVKNSKVPKPSLIFQNVLQWEQQLKQEEIH